MQFEDRLSKYLFGALFGEHTLVEVGSDLLPDTIYADVLIIPEEPLPELPGTGLFARHTQSRRCLVEAYSSSPSSEDLQTSRAKLQLALRRAYRDKKGPQPFRGCLWILTPYWPQKGLEEVFSREGEELEPGLLVWNDLEPIYLVNTSVIELREETLLFRLLSREFPRREAVLKIFSEQLEPYATLLDNFDLRFKRMAISDQIHEIDPRLVQDMNELRDTRREVLRELGKEEGREEGRQESIKEIALRMKEQGFTKEQIESVTGLTAEELDKLV